MDMTQEKHERAVADGFIDWYNERHGTTYSFHTRGADPPDFIYRDGRQEMLLETTATYYDAPHATMLWQNARGIPDAPETWSSEGPDRKLVAMASAALKKKCAKDYPRKCILVVGLYPDITSAEEFQELLPDIQIPEECSFTAIYLAGAFPSSSGGTKGGYYCWKLV